MQNKKIESSYRSYQKLNKKTNQLRLQDISRPKPRWHFTKITSAYYQKVKKRDIN